MRLRETSIEFLYRTGTGYLYRTGLSHSKRNANDVVLSAGNKAIAADLAKGA